MGSGICGLIGVRDLLGLPTEIVGVVADGAPATLRSFEAGHVVSTEAAATFVDGVACRVPDADAVAAHRRRRGARRRRPRRRHPGGDAGAPPLHALGRRAVRRHRPRRRDGRARPLAGTRVAVILSGGNADTDLLVEVLSG